jgi:hypothetical protein
MNYTRCRRLLVAVSCLVLTAFTGLEALFAPTPDLWARWAQHDKSSGARIDHSNWTALLKKTVRRDPKGVDRVDYVAYKAADRKRLADYLSVLSKVPVDSRHPSEQRAFWINLYNALTVKTVLDHYPVDSIRDIDISPGIFVDGPWDKKLIKVEGIMVSLNDIEHRILRPVWRDPRLHYALNCASIGCPDLQDEAFTADNSEALLDRAARNYVNDARGVRFNGKELAVSKIYLWFQEDFDNSIAGVLAHLRRYAEPALAARLAGVTDIDGFDYDWSLNDVR